MPRTIWKGQISFGLVEIPVGLYPATDSGSDLSFSMLDGRDNAPIGYKKVNKKTGEEVPNDAIVKAYELEDEHYVVVTDEDFAKANVHATQTIDIVAFVDAAEIDVRYYDKPYYLAPTRKGSKAFVLLREVLKRTGKVGIAKVVMRSRQYVGAVMPLGDGIVLDLLRYAYELRDIADLDLPGESLAKLGVSDKELKMAEQLVEQLADAFAPDDYKDDYRDDLLALIHEKAEAGDTETVAKPVDASEEKGGGEVIDIMALLKRSVEKAGEKPVKKAKKRAAAK